MAEPHTYEEILGRGHVLGRDFRVAFGDTKLSHCLLVAPHGGGIEPGTSEIMRAVADLGDWAWYEFAGFLRKNNQKELRITSIEFNEPTLVRMLPQTAFVVSFHGASENAEPIIRVGGKWEAGRRVIAEGINATRKDHGIEAVDAWTATAVAKPLGLEDTNLTNRGKFKEGVQLEFSRSARNLLFPPDASREARGRRSIPLRLLAASINSALDRLCQSAR